MLDTRHSGSRAPTHPSGWAQMVKAKAKAKTKAPSRLQKKGGQGQAEVAEPLPLEDVGQPVAPPPQEPAEAKPAPAPEEAKSVVKQEQGLQEYATKRIPDAENKKMMGRLNYEASKGQGAALEEYMKKIHLGEEAVVLGEVLGRSEASHPRGDRASYLVQNSELGGD